MNNLESLAAALESAKAQEDAARKQRMQIEEQICDYMNLPVEGTSHIEAGHWKGTVTAKLNRALDEAKLRQVAHQIPDDVGAKVIRWKPDLVLKELRAVQEYRPDVYKVLASAITTKPAKPAVKLTRIEEEAA